MIQISLSKLLASSALICMFSVGLSACDGARGAARGAAYPSSYEGTWMGRDILEYRKSGSEKVICDNIENDRSTGFQDELKIGGHVIDRLGYVYDFTMHEADFKSKSAMWRILSDGSTVDHMDLNAEDKKNCDDCSEIVSLNVRKLDSDTMADSWTLRDASGKLYSNDVTYYRVSPQELADIQVIFKKCKSPAHP